MTPEYALSLVIRPVLSWMGSRYSSVDAERMMLAIGIQESGFQHRRQIVGIAEYGPARGWWQFERPGVAEALRGDRHDLIMRLGLPNDPDQLHSIIQWSEAGAAVCARQAVVALDEFVEDACGQRRRDAGPGILDLQLEAPSARRPRVVVQPCS